MHQNQTFPNHFHSFPTECWACAEPLSLVPAARPASKKSCNGSLAQLQKYWSHLKSYFAFGMFWDVLGLRKSSARQCAAVLRIGKLGNALDIPGQTAWTTCCTMFCTAGCTLDAPRLIFSLQSLRIHCFHCFRQPGGENQESHETHTEWECQKHNEPIESQRTTNNYKIRMIPNQTKSNKQTMNCRKPVRNDLHHSLACKSFQSFSCPVRRCWVCAVLLGSRLYKIVKPCHICMHLWSFGHLSVIFSQFFTSSLPSLTSRPRLRRYGSRMSQLHLAPRSQVLPGLARCCVYRSVNAPSPSQVPSSNATTPHETAACDNTWHHMAIQTSFLRCLFAECSHVL